MAKKKMLNVLSSAAVGVLLATALGTGVYAKVTDVIVNSNGKDYSYNYIDLKSSYVKGSLGIEDEEKLFEDYSSKLKDGNLKAYNDGENGYIEYDAIRKASILQENFELNTYTESETAKANTVEVGALAKVSVKDGQIVIDEEEQQQGLKVESVSAINANGVTVTFATAPTADMSDITVNVVSPSGKTIAVSAKTVLAGTKSTTFLFTAAQPFVEGGTWTVDGIEYVAESTNANLSGLSFDTGNLDKEFEKDELTYTLNVAKDTDTVNLTATSEDSSAIITGTVTRTGPNDQVILKSGVARSITLNDDSNTTTITVNVLTEGGESKTYTVTVNEATGLENNDASLSTLGVTGETLSPTFDAGKFSYDVSVVTGKSSIALTETKGDSNASVEYFIGDKKITDPVNVALAEGLNVIRAEVTAEDGVTKLTYTLNVRRAGKNASTDATLAGKSLETNVGTTSNWDASDKANLSIGSDVTEATIAPVVNHPGATIEVNNASNLKFKDNKDGTWVLSELVDNATVDIVVTAEDASTAKTYKLTVDKASATATDNVTLSTFNFNGNPVKDGDTILVANSQDKVVATGELVGLKAANTAGATLEYKVNGIKIVDTAGDGIENDLQATTLKIGNNTVEVLVTAADNVTTKTYTLNIKRAAVTANDVNTLNSKTLTVSTGNVTAWDDMTNNTAAGATLSIAYNTDEVTITPVAKDSNAIVKVAEGAPNTVNVKDNGNGTFTLSDLDEAETVTITVTAEDGTPKVHTLTIAKADATASDNVRLGTFTVENGTDPVKTVKDGDTVYIPNTQTDLKGTGGADQSLVVAAEDSSIDNDIEIKVNGEDKTTTTLVATLTAVNAEALKVGNNVIEIKVTAANKVDTKTYTLNVNRASGQASKEAGLTGLTVDKGILTITGDGKLDSTVTTTATDTASLSLTSDINEITLSPVLADSTASVSVKSDNVASNVTRNANGSYTVNRVTDGDDITLVVTSENLGVTYTVTIEVAKATANASKDAEVEGIYFDIDDSTATASKSTTKVVEGKTYTVSNDQTKIDIAIDPKDAEVNVSDKTKQTFVVKQNGTVVSTTTTGAGAANVIANLAVNADLIQGANNFEIKVIAEDKATTKTYTFTVNRVSSNNSVEGTVNGKDLKVAAPTATITSVVDVDGTDTTNEPTIAKDINLDFNFVSSTAKITKVAAVHSSTVTVIDTVIAGETVTVKVPAGLKTTSTETKNIIVKVTVEDNGLEQEYTITLN